MNIVNQPTPFVIISSIDKRVINLTYVWTCNDPFLLMYAGVLSYMIARNKKKKKISSTA